MKRTLSLLCLAAMWLPAAAPPVKKPKLVLAIIVDQFRYDYLHRWRAQYQSGLARLMDRGAVFTNAHYEHFPTVTAIGHSTFLSGATPSVSGIVGNEWYDRSSGKQVTSVTDETVQILGAAAKTPASPRRLLVSTLADELKMSGSGKSKAIGISMKDRSAILPVGRMANAAYWFDAGNGNFVSTTYYFPKLPAWVEAFNQTRVVDQWVGKTWTSVEESNGASPLFTLPDKADGTYYTALERVPYGNDVVEMFAEKAVEAEQLGQRGETDVLALSFSANDRIGHDVGPDDPRVRDVSIRTDRVLGRFFDYLDKKVGMANVLVVLTADHGVAPLPEVMEQRRMPGGRITEATILEHVQNRLTERYGEGKWVVGKSGPAPYLDHNLIKAKGLNLAEVQRTAAEVVRSHPHIFRVYTGTQLANGQILDDLIDRRVRNGYHWERAADLFIVPEPYWLFEAKGTSHGTPFNYDTHVPLLMMGPGVRPGRYHKRAAVNDIAPTLANILEVEVPAGSIGRSLDEVLTN